MVPKRGEGTGSARSGVCRQASTNNRVAALQSLFAAVQVNGQSTPVAAGDVTAAGWGTPVDATVATLSLKKGKNVVSFTRGTADNFNIYGLTFLVGDSVETLALGMQEHIFMVAVNDPFAAANGGSVVQGTAEGSQTPVLHGDGYYEKIKGAVFTMTVTASEDVDAQLIVKLSSAADRTAQLQSLFASASVNGQSVSVNSGSITAINWSTPVDAAVATVSLKKGTNVITFTRGTADNFNIWGASLETVRGVALTVTATESNP